MVSSILGDVWGRDMSDTAHTVFVGLRCSTNLLATSEFILVNPSSPDKRLQPIEQGSTYAV